MISFETPIPVFWIITGFLLATAILLWLSTSLRSLIRPAYLWSITGLRTFACLTIALLLLNPYRIQKEPDADGFRIAILLDASGSMETRDIANGSQNRFDIISDWLSKKQGSPIHQLRNQGHNLDISLFAGESLPLAGTPHLLPGGTAIGAALRNELTKSGRRTDLGGLLLASDGQANIDPSAIEAARQFRTLGIPISTIGIGSPTPPGEIRAGFTQERFQGEKGEPMELSVSLKNSRNNPEKIDLELHSEEGFIDRKQLTLPPNSEEITAFNIIPFKSGGQAFRIIAKSENSPEQTDIAAVDIREPDRFRILWLSGKPGLEYRFLQQSAEDSDQISIGAIIQTGAESFFHHLTDEEQRQISSDGFPEKPDFYNSFDAIIVDNTFWSRSPENHTLFRDFVANRGGGLLLTGDPSLLPTELQALVPVTETSKELPFSARNLSIIPAPVFTEVTGGILFRQPPLFIPQDLPVLIAKEWKRGARPILQTADNQNQQPLMMAQAYGAGRVAWLGTENTWRWRMASTAGTDQHKLFWNNLMVWLASTGKPRISTPLSGKRVALAEEIETGIEVMGSDFRPAREAEVEATILTPAGETVTINLQPSFRQQGRFENRFTPDGAGEYRIRYRITFPDGEELSQDAFFIASHSDREREETAYNEELLRDIARLTGGEFFHYTDASKLRDIPLKEGIPTRESRRYLAGNPLFLLLLALPLFAEWYLRRKIGLK